MPMAVMSTASRGEFLKGLYATRSIPTPSSPQAIIATAIAMSTPASLSRVPESSVIGHEQAKPGDRPVEHGQAHEGADHEVVAVGEVDELDDPVDQRVTEGDERDDGPVGYADNELRGELRRLPDRLHGEYYHERGDEDHRDSRPPARGPDARSSALGARLRTPQWSSFHALFQKRGTGRDMAGPLAPCAPSYWRCSSTSRSAGSSNSPSSTRWIESSVRLVSPSSSKLQVPRMPS